MNRLPVLLKQGTRVQARDVENLSPAMRAGKRSACLGGMVSEWAQGRPSSEAWKENLLGEVPGQGFAQLMDSLPQERLVIAVQAVASMVAALDETISYVKGRTAFNERIFDFQNTRFVLAECATATEIGKAFVEKCVAQLVDGQLDPSLAAMAKLWTTEQQFDLVDRCLQLFGGYGYLSEYPISQMWADARVQRIFGGTSEIMKELIGRSL